MAISSSSTGLRPGVCTSTTRPTAPYTGQIIYETDTGYLRVWDGAAWDYLSQSQNTAQGLPAGDSMGLVHIAQSTNSTTTANTISNCFSSTYSNYRIIGNFSGGGGAVGIYARLRTSSGDDSANNYKWGRYYIRYDNVLGATGGIAETQWWVSELGSNGKGFLIIDLFNPNVAAETYFSTQQYSTIQATAASSYLGGASGMKDATTQFTGINFYTSTAGNFTSTINVYGYRQL